MLQFITQHRKFGYKIIRFNTSHVVVYLDAYKYTYVEPSFNTSHVVVYRIVLLNISQVHSRFNTSHVVVYRTGVYYILERKRVSIHLMLQFIRCNSHAFTSFIAVSIHLMLQFISPLLLRFWTPCRFQYISCCSLSTEINYIAIGNRGFQYISCCSLSQPIIKELLCRLEFQYISCCSLSVNIFVKNSYFCSFNTSHVVVYLLVAFSKQVYNLVSIHLMLQFIGEKIEKIVPDDSFQYISCCSLSSCVVEL